MLLVETRTKTEIELERIEKLHIEKYKYLNKRIVELEKFNVALRVVLSISILSTIGFLVIYIISKLIEK